MSVSAQEIIRPGRLLRTSNKSATAARRSPVILVIPACDEAASIGRVLSDVPPELVADVTVVVGSADDPTTRVAAAQEARVLVQLDAPEKCRPVRALDTEEHEGGGGMKTADRVVYVVAKAPRPGSTKTRLCPPLSPDQAAQLAGAFLLDTIANVNLAGVTARIVCRDASEQQPLRRLVGPRLPVSVQSGKGLGDAVEGAFRDGFADGASAVAVLGADSPTLPGLLLREAFAALAHGFDVVLGPAEDGGYYLLAARTVHPWLFRAMRWSTDGVASETLRRCRTLDLRTYVLPAWYDVDDAASLHTLRTDLLRLPASIAAHTRTVLKELDDPDLPLGDAA